MKNKSYLTFIFVEHLHNMFKKSDVHLHQIVLWSQLSQGIYIQKIYFTLYSILRNACTHGLKRIKHVQCVGLNICHNCDVDITW